VANAILIGSSVGAIIGLIHAWGVYVRRTSEVPERLTKHPVAVRARAAYFALWTFFLWVLFGTYVFYLWVISIVIYAIYNVLKILRS
jgi:hypothetical protein